MGIEVQDPETVGMRCSFISQTLCPISLHFWPAHSPKLHFSLCHCRLGPLLLNLPLCPLLQTSAVSNLALWPTSPLPIYLNISPIASAPLSFPSFPHAFYILMLLFSLSAALSSSILFSLFFFFNLHCSRVPSPIFFIQNFHLISQVKLVLLVY